MRRGPPKPGGGRPVGRARGFSLIEALVAILILALMGGVTFGTFARSMDARDRATDITERYRELRQALTRMSSEVSQAFLSLHKDYSEPRTTTLFAGKRASGGMRLDFTSFSHYKFIADANECDQNELSYFLAPDKNNPGQYNLMRREQVRIDERPDEGGDELILAHNVSALSFSFYNPKSDRWEDDWDSRSANNKNKLPKFVRIELTAADPVGKEMKLSVKTRVFLREAILITGSGFSPGVD